MTWHLPSSVAATTCLVVLAKAPERGQVKTRLAADLGSDGALRVYRRLLAITAASVVRWPGPALLSIRGDAAAFAATGLEHLPRIQQPEGDLGACIAEAIHAGLGRAASALVIGTDCPGLDLLSLQAVAMLATEAAVAFGPATDGGFWSIGTRLQHTAAVLTTAGLPWSTPETLRAVRSAMSMAGFDSRLGPTIADCDTFADLQRAVARRQLPSDSLLQVQTETHGGPGTPPISDQHPN